MPWWYPFGCIAFIVGGILIFLKPKWLWALTEQWKSYAADGPSDFYIPVSYTHLTLPTKA